MQLPVYLNGERAGEVTISPQGRFWRAQVWMRDAGRVARLSLYGRGGEAYLGIPEPDGHGGMTLSRVLRTLPEGVEYAAERAGMTAPEKRTTEKKPPRHVVWMGGKPYYF